MKPVRVALGAFLVLIGVVWFLQGIDVLGGSVMSGVTLWAVVGPVVAVVGLALAASGLRGGARRNGRDADDGGHRGQGYWGDCSEPDADPGQNAV